MNFFKRLFSGEVPWQKREEWVSLCSDMGAFRVVETTEHIYRVAPVSVSVYRNTETGKIHGRVVSLDNYETEVFFRDEIDGNVATPSQNKDISPIKFKTRHGGQMKVYFHFSHYLSRHGAPTFETVGFEK